MERKRAQAQDEITVNFLKLAAESGAIERYKEAPYSRQAALHLNILAIYWGTYFEQADIANQTSLSRQSVNQHLESTITKIWKHCPIELREKYPLQAIPYSKSPESSTIQLSRTNVGTKISSLLEQGVPASEISAQTGVRLNAIIRLNSSKIKIRAEKSRESREIQNQSTLSIKRVVRESDDPKQVQNAIDLLTLVMANDLTKKNNPDFIPLTNIFTTSPTGRFPEIANLLLSHNLPILRINRGVSKEGYETINYYIRKKDRPQIEALLEQTKDFSPKALKIKLFAGPEPETLPNTTSLKKDYVGTFSGIAKSANSHALIKRGITKETLLEGSPFSIISYRRNFFVHKKNYGKMQQFLRRRLKELKIPTKKRSR